MSRFFGWWLRLPLRMWGAVRRHPHRTFLALFVLVVGLGSGVWWYAVRQWRAAGIALSADRPEEARERLAVCLRVWPRSPEVLLRAARAARLAGDFPAAEDYLNRSMQLRGGATDRATEGIQLEFLLMRVQSGEMDELAAPLFEKVDEGHPDSPEILATIARAYMHRLRYMPAYNCLTRWIELQPDNAKPVHWRGWVLERLDSPQKAKDDYEHALEMDPNLVDVRLRVAELLLEAKQAPEAVPHLERLYRQDPNNARVRARLGDVPLPSGSGRGSPAADGGCSGGNAGRRSVADFPCQSRSPGGTSRGRGGEGAAACSQPIRSIPRRLFVLHSALQFQNRTTEATAVYAEYQRTRALLTRIDTLLKDSDSPSATADNHAELGALFLQIGRDKVGLYWLNRALDRDSTSPRAHRVLADYYEGKGDRGPAEMHRRQIPGSAPTPAPGGPGAPARP